MSGGHFNYDQYKIGQIADDIELLIETNDDKSIDEWGSQRGREYDPEIISAFREAVFSLRVANIYAQRIDWLVSGDDGEESFIRRLENDLGELAIKGKEK